MASSTHTSPQVTTSLPQEPGLLPPVPTSSPPGDGVNQSPPSLNIQDLKTIAADIKDTLSAAIADL